MQIDLDKLDDLELSDLQTARNKLDKAIEGFHARKVAKATAVAEAALKEFGLSLNDIMPGAPAAGSSETKAKRVVAPKYIDPNDSTNTWTGRGRKPKWVEYHLAEGKTMDDLLIVPAADSKEDA